MALRDNAGSPFAEAARSAAQKVLATLPADVRSREQALKSRVYEVGDPSTEHPDVRVIAAAVEHGRVLRSSYTDRNGAATERDVEPLGFMRAGRRWYLVAHCRLRDDVRGFLLEHIRHAAMRDEPVPYREEDALRRELDRVDARAIGSDVT